MPNVLSALKPITTPLHIEAWTAALANHPDAQFRHYIITGLTQGFRIGFNRACPLRSTYHNMPSAGKQTSVVENYLAKERAAGHLIGPLAVPSLHVNRFGVIPKGHSPGKWRLITDLSHPPGGSVNDGVNPQHCSLSYVTVDTVASIVASLGPSSLMAKVDIESAYRLIPVHPDDRPLLAVRWRGETFCDGMLPFGLRSAPKIFTAVADALEWCAREQEVSHIYHYLDDFIIIGPPDSDQCRKDLSTLESICTTLGVPLAAHKREGPTTCLTFLGIEMDSRARILRLPADKLQRLISVLQEWGDKKVCTRRELESLIGVLNHACKVVRPGRTFLRRMIDLLSATGRTGLHHSHHHIRLNREFRADLAWWRCFVEHWNGVELIQGPKLDQGLEFTSDASGSWGCGASYGNQWFQYSWDAKAQLLHIAVKELVPIVMAAAVWGHNWKGSSITCYCDNQTVVAVMNSRSSRDRHLMHLLRCLFFYEARGQFKLLCSHIPGIHNGRADDLSRNNLSAFLLKVPTANKSAAAIPAALPNLLLSTEADWISPAWIRLFNSTLNRAWPSPPNAHTEQQ